ncbi:DUF952 domain-containing protein [Acanthopleuribacter pedis]|uniref:DUF952 domain-containing protein n=1 Tax=Acanthopleuribacter pedis TaxID=442870 RepID=A0A8J7U3S5_9BACT|nr:DUF952 domain-containing protein [Acanthopleuribacter pedis]MBO1317571.1 DUF952 domain-containing protein [Acanthopleuribacter pedis]
MIYHIVPRGEWQSQGDQMVYTPKSLGDEGFIHCSELKQLLGSASRYYKGRTDLLVLTVDPNRVIPTIVFENAREGEEPFPHIYGPLNRNAVVGIHPLQARPDGEFTLPETLAG